jgi:uncharacterized protein YcfJ
MAIKNMRAIQAAVLSVALALPATNAMAVTTHHHRVRHTTVTVHHHRHHYSETRGTAVGAVAGAIIDHKQPLKGAVIGGVLGNLVQKARNHH